MKQVISGLILVMAVAGTGCALTEAVTPPPPQIGDLPPEAQALLARAVPQCKDPAQVKASFAQQLRAIDLEQAQVRALMDEETNRWQRRHNYLERELNFYEKEVRRTGGNWQMSNASRKAAVPLKVSTDAAFIDQIKRQREREYNEQQYRHFYRKLHFARDRHQKRMAVYQARLDELKQATQACGALQVALRKAKEEAALQKNAQAAPPLPVLHTQVVPVDALPLDALSLDAPSSEAPVLAAPDLEAVPLDAVPPGTLPAAPKLDPEIAEPEAQTMEQLLALPPVTAPPVEAAATLPPPAQAQPVMLPATPAAETAAPAQPIAREEAPEPAPSVAETMEQLLRQPAPQPWAQVAQP